MTPVAKSYTISKELTGYESDQTINPSELSLWRVLRVNSDGTIDMISEYISNEMISFQGEVGYKNYVGALNMLASAYTNSDYTIGSRYPGYNGQTEFLSIDHLSKESSGAATGVIGGTSIEPYGGGDWLHRVDTSLIKKALNSMEAFKKEESVSSTYWIAGRYWNQYVWTALESNVSSDAVGITLYDVNKASSLQSRPLRPILTLKSGLNTTQGNGTQDSPYIFE